MASVAFRLICGLLAAGVLGALTHARGGIALDSLGHAAFAALAAVALLPPPSPQSVDDSGTPSLRALATALPAFLFLQIVLGAATRYDHLGYLPHILGALAVSAFAYLAAIFAMMQAPGHPAIRLASIAVLVSVTLQVLLGILALVGRITSNGSILPLVHLAAGALTLAVGVLFALQIRRHVRTPAAADLESRSALAR
ncbi:MAG: hypothetical protein SFV54_21905 [Bryobacteraceae bacterium]|nr:hypothetical protein [Bryobacteraceae bacterium]